MRRQAILIGDNNAAHSPLLGVDNDIFALSGYFRSNLGGAWEPDEIVHLPQPDTAKLRDVLTTTRATSDFLIVAFSGHGGHDPQYGSYICLHSHDDFLVSNVAYQARRELVLIDACRTPMAATLVEGITKAAGRVDMRDLPGYRASCRALYEKAVMSAEEGSIILHACGVNQTAADTAQGGAFTQALMAQSATWAAGVSRQIAAVSVLDAHHAFDGASVAVAKRYFPQQPLIEHGRRRTSFPFAVA